MKRLLYPLQFIYSSGFNMVARLMPAFLTRFSSSATEIGTVSFVYNLAKSLNLPCGMAVDRIGKERAIFMALFIIPFLAISMSIFSQVYQFALAFFVVGILANFYYTSINSLVGIYKRKTESFFQLETAYQLGVVIGPLIGGFLMSAYGGYAAFYAWAIFSFAGLGISTLIIRRRERTGRAVIGRPLDVFRELASTGRLRSIVFLAVGSFLTGILLSMKDLSIPLYATDLGMNIYMVGVILAISSVVSVVALPLLGRLLEGVRKEKSLILGLLIISLSFFLINYATDLFTIGILTGVFMVGRNMGLNLSRSFMSGHVSNERMATGMSIVDMIHFGGAMIGPFVAGILIDFVSFSAVFAFVSVAALMGAAVIAVSILRR